MICKLIHDGMISLFGGGIKVVSMLVPAIVGYLLQIRVVCFGGGEDVATGLIMEYQGP